MNGYQTPPRREPMPEYTTWTMAQLKSARRALEAIDRYRAQRASGIPFPAEPAETPGTVWVVTDLDGVRHDIYMDEPTQHQIEQANFTPLPTVHEIPEVHPTHDMTSWKGFRTIHHKCSRCGRFRSEHLAQPCAKL